MFQTNWERGKKKTGGVVESLKQNKTKQKEHHNLNGTFHRQSGSLVRV